MVLLKGDRISFDKEEAQKWMFLLPLAKDAV
jgi:hypothetical protein